MDFISIPNLRLAKDRPIVNVINVDYIVSFSDYDITLSTGELIPTTEETIKALREYLLKKKHTITKLGG